MYKRERCEKYYFIHVTFGAHVVTWVISAGERDLPPVHRTTGVDSPEDSGTTLKKEGNNVV